MSRVLSFSIALVALASALPCDFTLELGPQARSVTLPGSADVEDTLHWDAEPDRGFNINGTYSYGCAQRYTETAQVTVKAILYYLTGSADDVFVYVAGESTEATPGEKLDTTRANGQGGGVWKRANMPHPPTIEPNTDFWACVIIRRHPSGQYPLTLDLGPIVPWRGGYITWPPGGPDWYQLTDPPFWTDRNVNIRAIVERGGTGVEEELVPTGRPGLLCVLPTVSSGLVSVSYRGTGPASVTVSDAAGRRVLHHLITPSPHRPIPLDLRGIAAGVYLVTASGGAGSAYARVVVK